MHKMDICASCGADLDRSLVVLILDRSRETLLM